MLRLCFCQQFCHVKSTDSQRIPEVKSDPFQAPWPVGIFTTFQIQAVLGSSANHWKDLKVDSASCDPLSRNTTAILL